MESLAGNFLISTPPMPDPRFQRQVIYLCAHNDEGAMGLVINNPNPELTLFDVFHGANLAIPEGPLPPVYMGGPVEMESGFILFTSRHRSGRTTSPALGSISPPRIFIRVDLPQPLAPIRP